MKRILAIEKIRNGDDFFLEGAMSDVYFAKRVRKEDPMMFRFFRADADYPKGTEILLYEEVLLPETP